jgi:cullin-4
MVEALEKLWNMLNESLIVLRLVFRYFESTNLSQKKHKTFDAFVVSILKCLFLKHENFCKEIIKQTNTLIKAQRNSEIIEANQIKALIDLMVAIDLYKPQFEDEFLKETLSYYKSESQTLTASFVIRKFLIHVEERLNQETERINKYLDKTSGKKLMNIVETCLITDNIHVIMNDGLDTLMTDKDFENLSRIYKFLMRVDKLEFLKKSWNFIIKERGNTLVANPDDKMIDVVLLFKKDLEEIIERSFDKNSALKTSMEFAFSYFINIKTNTFAELTSKYIDNRLRKPEKPMIDESEVENNLHDFLDLFKYLASKDVFEAFYTKRLVKRLLLGQMSSKDLEMYVVDKLRKGKILCANSN